MGHIDVSAVEYSLSDGRVLLNDVSFRVGDGAKVALIGPNGSGKTTLVRMICGDISPDEGSVAITGGLGVMRQFIGSVRDETTVREILISVAPARIRDAAAKIIATEKEMNEDGSEKSQMAYAQAIIDWGDCGGYDFEVIWDKCCTEMLDKSFDEVADRKVNTLSGGEQKKLVLRALLEGPEEVLLLDEPDNYLDVPSKRWLEQVVAETKKSILFVSHDRELLQNTATRIVALEQGVNGNTAWVHGAKFDTWHEARKARNERFAELLLRWEQEHQRLIDLVRTLQVQAASSPDMANKYHAMQTRLRKFEEAGAPEAPPIEQDVKVGLRGGRTGLRALTFENLSLANLTEPFNFEVFFGDRIAVGLDVRGQTLSARGWTRDGGDLFETITRLDRDGCVRYVVTDVTKDGTLRGPNVDLLKQMCERTDMPVIASGGIATLADLIELRALTDIGVEGAIVGKALYARAFTLEEAIEVSGPQV